MQNMRRVTVALLIPLFSILLFVFAVNAGVVKVITNPPTVKKILNDSGVYNSTLSSLLDQAKTINAGGVEVPLTNPVVRAAANKVITPDYVRQNTEKFIDSVYAWLDGKTQTPDFNINILSVKTDFATDTANSLSQRLSELPACPPGTNFMGFDAFNATCLPRGVTAQQASQTIKDNIINGKGFLDEANLNANSLKATNSNQSVFSDQLKDAPQTYQKAKRSPIIIALLILLVGAGIVLLSTNKRLGIRKLGITFLSIGILILIFAWAMAHGADKAIDKVDLGNPVMQLKVRIVVKDIVKTIDKLYWIIGASYAVIGVGAIAGSMYLFNRKKPGDKPEYKPVPIDADEPAGPRKIEVN